MTFTVIVSEKSGAARRLEFAAEAVTIGRAADNEVCLPSGNISKKHGKIVVQGGIATVADLDSTNGIYVNGQKLERPRTVSASDEINIGDYVLRVETAAAKENGDVAMLAKAGGEVAIAARKAIPANDYAQTLELIHRRLIEALDLRRLDLDAMANKELWDKTAGVVRQIVAAMDANAELGPGVDREELTRDVLNEALGLGPLEIYLADDSISEIMVNGPEKVFVERDGRLQRALKGFSSEHALSGVIERIVAPLGRHIDESSPLVDARLKDGSRVNAVIPPLSLKGPCITIRKFKRERLGAQHLIGFGALTQPMASFLEACVAARRNLLISGGTGSGKTTLLNVLSSFIPQTERIVTIEDAAELQLAQEHWVQLETRPRNIEGKGEVSIRDLVKNALRMRPDRIVVGECRGGEALDMLQAMNTGHDGSLTTLHANSPRDALSRLTTMVLMSGMELPMQAVREQIASAVNIVVQVTRFAEGSRKITAISEVAGMESGVVSMQDIFVFEQQGFGDDGKVRGRFVATGCVPKFFDDLQRRGMRVDRSIFAQ